MSSSGTFASNVSDNILDKFYSIPASTCAVVLPGLTHESTLAVLEVLRDDFKTHHPFINEIRFFKQVSVQLRWAHETNGYLFTVILPIMYWQYMH
jgi:hypothetical protein